MRPGVLDNRQATQFYARRRRKVYKKKLMAVYNLLVWVMVCGEPAREGRK